MDAHLTHLYYFALTKTDSEPDEIGSTLAVGFLRAPLFFRTQLLYVPDFGRRKNLRLGFLASTTSLDFGAAFNGLAVGNDGGNG